MDIFEGGRIEGGIARIIAGRVRIGLLFNDPDVDIQQSTIISELTSESGFRQKIYLTLFFNETRNIFSHNYDLCKNFYIFEFVSTRRIQPYVLFFFTTILKFSIL